MENLYDFLRVNLSFDGTVLILVEVILILHYILINLSYKLYGA